MATKPAVHCGRIARIFALVTALVLVAGCEQYTPGQSGTAVVIFVDFSQSISGDGLASFRREVEGDILPSLTPGDRLLIAPINDKTLTEFRPLVDAVLPP